MRRTGFKSHCDAKCVARVVNTYFSVGIDVICSDTVIFNFVNTDSGTKNLSCVTDRNGSVAVGIGTDAAIAAALRFFIFVLRLSRRGGNDRG